MKNFSDFWSKEPASDSFRKKRAIGNLVIVSIPVLAALFCFYQGFPLTWKSVISVIFVICFWLATELALINFMCKLKGSPLYIQECFQLNLLFGNLWFMLVAVGLYAKVIA